jgi:DNA mismatch repair protein MutS
MSQQLDDRPVDGSRHGGAADAGAHANPDEPVSLLWPPGRHLQDKGGRLSTQVTADLEIDRLVRTISGGEFQRQAFAGEVLTTLCTDPQVIDYRLDALTELLEDDGLRIRLEKLLPSLTALTETVDPKSDEGVAQQVVHRLWELTHYSEAVVQLREALAVAPLRAPAWRGLKAHVDAVATAETFAALEAELPTLHVAIERPRSVTIGVNLAPDLTPESAAILALSEARITGRVTFVDRVLGAVDMTNSAAELKGMLAQQYVAKRQKDDSPEHPSRGLAPLRGVQAAPSGRDTPLARDLRALLERALEPLRRDLRQYLSVHTNALRAIEPELAFLLQSAALVNRLREAGLPMCRPECAPIGQRSAEVQDSYNIGLALRMLQADSKSEAVRDLVTNPVTLGGAYARVWILTGPNRGGKTVYACSVGLAQVLFQAGLYVPARAARLSPADAIFTHFPAQDRLQPGMGRLDDEAARLSAIFAQAGPHSLILLNEVLAGTNGIEGLALARDVVRGLRLLGARAIYVTHLNELAERADEMNPQADGDARIGRIGSMVSEIEMDEATGKERRTFRIRPGAPQRSSYASTIAEQHGISFSQLEQLFRQRGIMPASAPRSL